MLFSSSPVLYHLHSYSLCPFFIFSYSLPFYFSLFFYFFFSLFFSSLFLLHSLFLGYFPLLLFIKSLLSAILVYFFPHSSYSLLDSSCFIRLLFPSSPALFPALYPSPCLARSHFLSFLSSTLPFLSLVTPPPPGPSSTVREALSP